MVLHLQWIDLAEELLTSQKWWKIDIINDLLNTKMIFRFSIDKKICISLFWYEFWILLDYVLISLHCYSHKVSLTQPLQ